MFDFDINKSLQELDGEDWDKLYLDSGLALRCTSLRQKPLKDFTAGDLRVMISQKISLKFLVPLAVDILLGNAYVQGDLYPGDLFVSVLNVQSTWWSSYDPWLVDLFNEVIGMVEDNMRMFATLILKYCSGETQG